MKLIRIIGATIAFIASFEANAGIPVLDAGNLIQAVQQTISWVQQAQDMVTTIDTEKQTLQNMTGSRALGMVLNNPSLQSYLPANAPNLYSSLSSGGYSSLTSTAKTLRDSNKLYNCEGMSSDFSSVCSSNLNKNSQDIDYSNNAYKVATDRNTQIQDLMGQINSTNDPKSIAELQARIAGENVSVANEANRIAIWKEMSAANERANQQKVAEWYVSALKRDSALSGTVYTP